MSSSPFSAPPAYACQCQVVFFSHPETDRVQLLLKDPATLPLLASALNVEELPSE